MKPTSTLRLSLILACLLLPLGACTSEDDGLVGLSSRPGATPSDDAPAAAAEDDGGAIKIPTPPPTPTPLPTGFDNSGTRPGMLSIKDPGAIGIGSGGNLYVASAPNTLVVLGEFGTLKATASLPLLPERFAFLGTTLYYPSGNALVTLDASNSVTSTVHHTERSPAFLAVATYRQQNQTAYRAVAAGSKVTIERGGVTDARDFPEGGAPVAVAFDFMGNLWGVGGTTLAKLKADPSEDPIVASVSDLGTLKGVVLENAVGDDTFWVLGTTGLARYNSAGERQGAKIALTGGDRLFVKGGKPVVVKDEAGEIVRFKADGAAEATIKLEGGIAGAAMDAQGNLWVSSRTENRILHTRFDQ